MTERGITKCEERMGTVTIREGLLHMEVATSQVTSRRTTNSLDPMDEVCFRVGIRVPASSRGGPRSARGMMGAFTYEDR